MRRDDTEYKHAYEDVVTKTDTSGKGFCKCSNCNRKYSADMVGEDCPNCRVGELMRKR